MYNSEPSGNRDKSSSNQSSERLRKYFGKKTLWTKSSEEEAHHIGRMDSESLRMTVLHYGKVMEKSQQTLKDLMSRGQMEVPKTAE